MALTAETLKQEKTGRPSGGGHLPQRGQPQSRAAKPSGKPKPGGFVDRWWHARIWLGFPMLAWWRLLWHNRFAVSPSRIAMAVLCSVVSVVHSGLRLLQLLFFSQRIERTEIIDGPVFIIGHWRSGTTLLHELLARDPRHAYAGNYECLAPHHCLITESWCKHIFGFLIAKQRPMDNMALGWDRPQEDEFALCALGLPSPYWYLGFPNRPQCDEYYDMRGIAPRALERWKRGMTNFVKLLTLRHKKRIVLKSPTHTGRVEVLRQCFPQARFIHMVREPNVLFASTMNMWKKMCQWQHIQTPRFENLDQYVFDTFDRMYAALERDRQTLPVNRFCEVRYEDLVRDPIGELQKLYEQLELGDFETARPGAERYLADNKDYQTNRFEIAPEVRAEVGRRWASYAKRYGYEA